MDSLSSRPSSWPIRRQRQQMASAAAMQRCEDLFASINEHLSRIAGTPPGLDCMGMTDLHRRVARLETLYVCRTDPIVDEVVDGVKSSRNQIAGRRRVETLCRGYQRIRYGLVE